MRVRGEREERGGVHCSTLTAKSFAPVDLLVGKKMPICIPPPPSPTVWDTTSLRMWAHWKVDFLEREEMISFVVKRSGICC